MLEQEFIIDARHQGNDDEGRLRRRVREFAKGRFRRVVARAAPTHELSAHSALTLTLTEGVSVIQGRRTYSLRAPNLESTSGQANAGAVAMASGGRRWRKEW